MIIRSADGESIVNFDNLSLMQMEIHDDTKEGEEQKKITYNIVAYEAGSTTCIVLAEYSTREQALNIIDEIIETYKGTMRVLTTGTIFEPSSDHILCASVYEMPEDDPEYSEHLED